MDPNLYISPAAVDGTVWSENFRTELGLASFGGVAPGAMIFRFICAHRIPCAAIWVCDGLAAVAVRWLRFQ